MTKEYLLQIPFYIEDISGNANTVSITKNNASAPTLTIEYSTDNSTWTTITMNSDTTANIFELPANGKLYLRGVNNSWGNTSNSNFYNIITTTGNHNVGGNSMSLLYSSEFKDKKVLKTSNVFASLFRGNTTLVNSKDLILPATTLTKGCYSSMFYGCTSLTTAPELPVTTLVDWCYYNMFSGCRSLTTAPELPATTLANQCYYMMFSSCSKLNYIKADFINYSNNNKEFNNWVQGVSSTGTFIMNPEATYDIEQIRGVNGIPTGWNAKNSIGVTFINIDSSKTNYLTINKLEGLYSNIELTYSTNYIDWITI